jgi:hypothetical protein
MQTFFALIKTDHDREYTVSLVTTETVLTVIEDEFDKNERERCEGSNSPIEAAKFKLATKWVLVEFFPYDLGGAQAFLKSARGLGSVYELRAIQFVQALRDDLGRAVDRSLDAVRAKVAQSLLSRVIDPANASSRVDYVRKVLDAGAEELIQLL